MQELRRIRNAGIVAMLVSWGIFGITMNTRHTDIADCALFVGGVFLAMWVSAHLYLAIDDAE